VSSKRSAVTNSVKLQQVMSPENVIGMENRVAFNQVLKLSNRKTWNLRAKAALDKAGLGEALEKALDETDDKLRNVHRRARTYVVELLSDSDLDIYQKHNDVRELFTALDMRYKGIAAIRAPQLHTKLTTVRMNHKESSRQFCDRIRELVDELEECDERPSQSSILSTVTTGLLPEYRMYTATWYGSPDNMPKDLADITERLMSIEQQIEQTSSSRGVPALAAQHGGRSLRNVQQEGGQGAAFHGKCFNCGAVGHQARACPEKEKQKEKKFCNICKKPGHSVEECWIAKRGGQRRSNVEDDDFGPPVARPAFMVAPKVIRPEEYKSQALPAKTIKDLLEEAVHRPPKAEVTWNLDSGAYNHISDECESMHDYRVLETPLKIVVGGNHTLYAVGYGDVFLKFKDSWEIDSRGRLSGGQMPFIKVKNVLHVPGFGYRLLSLRQLAEQGADFEGEKAYMVLRNCEEKWAFRAGCKDSIYKAQAREITSGEKVAFFAHPHNNRVNLWPARLGHLSLGNMKRMVNEHMVRGMDVSAERLNHLGSTSLCEGCVMGRHPRMVFPDSETKSKQCLELIHMDLCGPMSVDSHGGNRYIATFLDDFSGLSSVVLLKKKELLR